MHCKTMEIYEADSPERTAELEKLLTSMEGRHIAPLTRDQATVAKTLDRNGRKNYMRNQPCPCGGTKKFKKCCWSQYA